MGGLFATMLASGWARTALRYAVAALTILLFLFSLRRAGERAGRLAERLDTMETVNEAQRQMLDAAARRPRDAADLVERLRRGGF